MSHVRRVGEGDPGYSKPPTATDATAAHESPSWEKGKQKLRERAVGQQPRAATAQKTQQRLVGRDELVAQMPQAPKEDKHRLGVAIKMSTRYKDVLAKLDTYRISLASTKLAFTATERAAQLKKPLEELDALEKAVDIYVAKHPNSAAMQALKGQIATERRLLQETAADPRLDDHSLNDHRGFTLQQATELRRHGVTITPALRFELAHGDDRIEACKEHFAAGEVNTVARATYKNGQVKILKAEPDERGFAQVAGRMGIPRHQPHYACRNLATCAVDRVLGTDLVPASSLTIHNGRLHLVMDVARGLPGRGSTVKLELSADDDRVKMFARGFQQGRYNGANGEKRIAEDLQIKRMIREVNGDGSAKYFKLEHAPYQIDYSNPELMQSLSNLEWLDLITGQGDRHAGNYLIEMDANGTFRGLKAIDNDASFGANWTDMAKVREGEKSGGIGASGYNGVGLPALIDRQLADRLRAWDTWPKLEAALQDLLSTEELEATKARFDAAVAHIDKLEAAGHVVGNWTLPNMPFGDAAGSEGSPYRYLSEMPEDSYLGRDIHVRDEKIQKGVKLQPLPK